jgi:hypothetical protein
MVEESIVCKLHLCAYDSVALNLLRKLRLNSNNPYDSREYDISLRKKLEEWVQGLRRIPTAQVTAIEQLTRISPY